MNYKEIANKITGFSCPIFGISWQPPTLEVEIARRVITYLEDKRVLYNPYELEMPRHCNESIIQVRQFLTEQLYDVERNSELGKLLRGMRSACRKFLDITQNSYLQHEIKMENGSHLSMGVSMEYYSGLGELRGTIGALVGRVIVMYGLDCEGDLLKIIPLENDEEKNTAHNK